jgi:proline dehydrogenase
MFLIKLYLKNSKLEFFNFFKKLFMGILINFVKQWIAGENLEEAIERSKKLNEKGIGVILNFLGEELKDKKSVEETVEEYFRMIELLKKENINGYLSVKLTQLGLNIDEKYCFENLKKIAWKCFKNSKMLWIDMESSDYTQKTIDIYLKIFRLYKNVGLCIQSYLKRSENDVKRLLKKRGIIRLVKGAYKESEKVVFKKKEEINKNFLKIMKILFKRSKNYFAIATHDEKLIKEAIKLSKKYKKNFEFEMLFGVRERLKPLILKQGFKLKVYVPYGKDWIPYVLRRIREKPSYLIFAFKSIFI